MSPPESAGGRIAARIAARTAHDLNNLAAVFSGHLYLLRNAAEPPEEAYDAMEKALAHLDRLARSLTAVGGVGHEAPAAVDLNEVTKAAVESIRGPVELELAPSLRSARGCRRDLLAAVEALLANAREAASSEAPVRVLTRVDQDSIAILVEDSGPGVAPAVRQMNFDPFLSTKGEKGRGVGLTIASLVAALHGGRLTVEDRSEGGTRASLRLPKA